MSYCSTIRFTANGPEILDFIILERGSDGTWGVQFGDIEYGDLPPKWVPVHKDVPLATRTVDDEKRYVLEQASCKKKKFFRGRHGKIFVPAGSLDHDPLHLVHIITGIRDLDSSFHQSEGRVSWNLAGAKFRAGGYCQSSGHPYFAGLVEMEEEAVLPVEDSLGQEWRFVTEPESMHIILQ